MKMNIQAKLNKERVLHPHLRNKSSLPRGERMPEKEKRNPFTEEISFFRIVNYKKRNITVSAAISRQKGAPPLLVCQHSSQAPCLPLQDLPNTAQHLLDDGLLSCN